MDRDEWKWQFALVHTSFTTEKREKSSDEKSKETLIRIVCAYSVAAEYFISYNFSIDGAKESENITTCARQNWKPFESELYLKNEMFSDIYTRNIQMIKPSVI